MITDTAIEIVSPLAHRDITHICRVARTAIVATCSGCGETVYRGLHLPLIAHGLFCGRRCPCTGFVPTPEEEQAIERNRRNVDAGEDAVARKPVQRAVKPVEPVLSPEERRARMKQKLADAVRARWADPVKRAALVKSMTGRTTTQATQQQKPTAGRKRTIAPCLLAAGLSPYYNGPWK